ncbi:hypothetical protein KZZ08_22830 [Roseovarius mucosus]|uniref:hypothetical protein n=1 Tax=Roseovarius mucosus TaxID=215743 RepID=UPI001C5E22CF|nr:hypothetical protein [Roseovarius mucosus]MBW4976450.1 hypothetical protein [Roseovarius mucosus]
MGHTTLGVLPKTRYWNEVADLLAGTAPHNAIFAASAQAAEKDLLQATDDPVFIEAVRLLLAIPAAARAQDFGNALREQNLLVTDRPGLLDLISATTRRLDQVRAADGGRSDLGELAARALSKTLTTSIGDTLPGLFDATPDDVQTTARKLSWNKSVSEYTRCFFGSLVSGSLSYWLDRTLDRHIGDGHRFTDVAARNAFQSDLDQFAWESTRIIREFSGGWYGKTLYRDGGFNSVEAARFGSVALKKIVDDLRTRQVRRG